MDPPVLPQDDHVARGLADPAFAQVGNVTHGRRAHEYCARSHCQGPEIFTRLRPHDDDFATGRRGTLDDPNARWRSARSPVEMITTESVGPDFAGVRSRAPRPAVRGDPIKDMMSRFQMWKSGRYVAPRSPILPDARSSRCNRQFRNRPTAWGGEGPLEGASGSSGSISANPNPRLRESSPRTCCGQVLPACNASVVCCVSRRALAWNVVQMS